MDVPPPALPVEVSEGALGVEVPEMKSIERPQVHVGDVDKREGLGHRPSGPEAVPQEMQWCRRRR
jgi:hypothetical protein